MFFKEVCVQCLPAMAINVIPVDVFAQVWHLLMPTMVVPPS